MAHNYWIGVRMGPGCVYFPLDFTSFVGFVIVI